MLSFALFFSAVLLLSPVLGLDEGRLARILDYQLDNIGTGPYSFRFASSDGISREEEGNWDEPNAEDASLVVRGSYSYTDPESGQVYTVHYTADHNGFHPSGDHIKVPPFIPWDKHQHHHEEVNRQNLGQNDLTATTKLYLPSSTTKPPPISPPVRYFPTTLRPEIRPEVSSGPTRFSLNPVISTTESPISNQRVVNQGSTGIVPAESNAQNVIHFTDLDPKVQNTILKLITNDDVRGVNIQAINSI